METERTIFLKPREDDYDDLFRLYNHEQVREYLGGPDLAAAFDKKFEEYFSVQTPEIYWVVRSKEKNDFLGMVCITQEHDKERYEVSFQIRPEFWGQGYGTEVVGKTIKYAFEDLGLSELYAETQKKNVASVTLLKKLGMEEISEIQRYGEQQLIFLIKNSHTIK